MAMSKIPPLPVDLNERPQPGPIGGNTFHQFAPKKLPSSIEDQMAKVVAGISSTLSRSNAFQIPENLNNISTELNSLLIASAEAMVAEAQTLLDNTKACAESLREEIAKKAAEHAEFTERLKTFGKAVLEAHNRYHGESE